MRLLDVFKDEQLQKTFLISKIKADPYNYKISNKLTTVPNNMAFTKYCIYFKNNNAEEKLSDFLKLATGAFATSFFSSKLKFTSSELEEFRTKVWSAMELKCDLNALSIGSVSSFNNIVINESIFNAVLSYLDFPKRTEIDVDSSMLHTIVENGYLEAYLTLYLKCTSKSSLCPYLYFENTVFNDTSLKDLVNLKHIHDLIDANYSPVYYSIESPIDNVGNIAQSSHLERLILPIHNKVFKSKRLPNLYHKEFDTLIINEKEYLNAIYKLGIVAGLSYGCEIMYQYSTIKDSKTKELISNIFKLGHLNSSFTGKYLYKIDTEGMIKINSDLEALFNSDNEKRFNAFRRYIWEVLDSTILKTLKADIISEIEFFSFPLVFSKFVQDCNMYAIQKFRVDILTSLYLEAKDKGFDMNEFDTEDCESIPLSAIGGFGMSNYNDADPNSLMNLDGFANYNNTDSEIERSDKDINKKTKSTDTPYLEAIDKLRTGLEDSKYEYNIKFVKSNETVYNRDAYKNIAENVLMMSKSLIKQIREIKTYNTGGKQPGLFKGKLDKKNLWKYKTDPNIFYNNDYKIKEMDLAFGIILDMSGSMWGTGITNGQIVMILLHEVLNALRINHSIIGHDSVRMHQCNVYKYYHFKEEKEHTLTPPYELANIKALRGNCDSGALYYMQQCFNKVRNKDKICIIFSDGSPTECTGHELRQQVKDMEKSGIHVIGVGINFSSIKDYYNDYANGKNLKEMIDIVVGILTKYVLEKKE